MFAFLERLRFRWQTRGSAATPLNSLGVPLEQHEQISDRERFRREHGYSAGFDPDVATPEIAAHNAQVDAEYQAEVDRRKALYAEGQYTPRFFVPAYDYDVPDGCAPIVTLTDEVNWHMEIAADPGRRVDVTKDPGAEMQPIVASSELAQMQNRVGYLEHAATPKPRTVRDIIGSREVVLAACGGSEAIAAQVECNAMQAFGVSSLDEPIGGKA